MKVPISFADRRSAGRALAQVLAGKNFVAPVVLALPRGGVAVAAEIAQALKAPLDILLVRKIGVPFQPELAAAAVVDGSEPEIVTNEDVVELAGVSREYIDAQASRELSEIERRRRLYVLGRTRASVADRTVILVDDGIATGASIRAALRALKRKSPKALILAVPVAPAEAVDALRNEVDEVVCLSTPEPFLAIGIHYVDFHQISDAEVIQLLAQASECAGADPQNAAAAETTRPSDG
jgi:putative phosphoribosyl transferase